MMAQRIKSLSKYPVSMLVTRWMRAYVSGPLAPVSNSLLSMRTFCGAMPVVVSIALAIAVSSAWIETVLMG